MLNMGGGQIVRWFIWQIKILFVSLCWCSGYSWGESI